MKFTAALFTVGALAVVRRQATGLAGNIAAITSATESVTTALQAYTGDIQQALAVNGATGEVLTAIQAAQSTADGLTSIDQDTALSLAGPIQDLATAVDASISALIEKQPTFSGAGLTEAVLTSLRTQQEASTMLTDTIVSKLPEALQETGRNLSQPAADSLARGIAAYEGGASGGASSAASSATSAAATSAASSAAATESASTPAAMPTAPSGTSATATSTYTPMMYTGAASQQVVGLGALALGAFVAVM
ncbi:Putative Cell wall mannoprotein [Septoria linicola]|uniref:Cell wall mannoprotein n=1 Tax=Septoria linicola TaxID=215465 RepID=A0A9Q9ALI5_9PEZI|nr:putative Cell wall mannoprotein [Septoria linicola]USW48313.1 Putative Cell wall mannoprotein [Septoria linicola]